MLVDEIREIVNSEKTKEYLREQARLKRQAYEAHLEKVIHKIKDEASRGGTLTWVTLPYEFEEEFLSYFKSQGFKAQAADGVNAKISWA